MKGLRLTDAVIIAAVALLGLKVLGLLSGGAEEEPSRFARVLSHARSNYVPPDISRTGSVPEKKPEDGKAGPKPEAGRDTVPPEVRVPPAAFNQPSQPAPAPSSSERALLERLGERREELSRQARESEMRERLLETAERRIESRLNDLKQMEERGAGAETQRRAEGEATALKNLVTMYEAMKPKDAARVFDRLPHDVLVPVVLGMNPRKMAEVLALMATEPAEKLTVALARRGQAAEAPRSASLPATELPAIEPARR